jgi:twinkle protein
MTMTAAMMDVLTARGLDVELLDRLGFSSVQRGGGEALVVPFHRAGDIVRRKYRRFDVVDGDGPKWSQDKGGVKLAFNEDCLRDQALFGQPLIITEGEFDALAAIQAGFAKTISVPDGAPPPGDRSAEDLEGSKKYDWVFDQIGLYHKDQVPEIIIAADGDANGAAMLQDLSVIFGRYRCKFVTYPKARKDRGRERCKDLNEVLEDYGAKGVVETVNRAQWLKVDGVYRMSELPPLPAQVIYEPRHELFRENYKVRLGDFSVFTGTPGFGKTSFVNDVMCGIAQDNGLTIAWASFEQEPQRDHRRNLRGWFCGQPEQRADRNDIITADRWIDAHHLFIVPSEDDDASLDWILERMELAVSRHAASIIIIDPWNEIEHCRRSGETETEYIGRAIRALKRFAKAFRVHICVVAHPTKSSKDGDGNYKMPTLYDISGCYSDDTEVLTKRGWLRHDALTLDDDVACFEPAAASMTYQKPSRIVRKPYAGEMHAFQGYGYDLLVTPEHRMVVEPHWPEPKGTQVATGRGRPVKWPKGRWTFCEAAKLPTAQFNVPLAAPLVDLPEDGPSEPLAKIAGWYVAEGCKMGSGAAISQAVGPASDEIVSILGELGVTPKVTTSQPGTGGTLQINTIYIGARNAKWLVDYLLAEGGIGSANKRIPREIKSAPAFIKRAFLMAYLSGDGCAKGDGFAASTVSAALRDDLQRLSLELGLPCSWSAIAPAKPHHSPCWQINIGHDGRAKTALQTHRNRTIQHYDGLVWCLTVPTGAYFVRRKGKALACGNSANWYNKADLGVIVHRENEDDTLIKVQKSRYHEVIGKPGEVRMQFSKDERRFVEIERVA